MTTATNRPTALVAEDDRVLSDVVRLTLVRGGFDVTVANDGRKALEFATQRSFDVICSDYQMPHLNGEQFLTAVRAGGPSRDARMILCSAKAYELNSERLRDQLNLAIVLYKPFSLAEFLAAAEGRSVEFSLSQG